MGSRGDSDLSNQTRPQKPIYVAHSKFGTILSKISLFAENNTSTSNLLTKVKKRRRRDSFRRKLSANKKKFFNIRKRQCDFQNLEQESEASQKESKDPSLKDDDQYELRRRNGLDENNDNSSSIFSSRFSSIIPHLKDIASSSLTLSLNLTTYHSLRGFIKKLFQSASKEYGEDDIERSKNGSARNSTLLSDNDVLRKDSTWSRLVRRSSKSLAKRLSIFSRDSKELSEKLDTFVSANSDTRSHLSPQSERHGMSAKSEHSENFEDSENFINFECSPNVQNFQTSQTSERSSDTDKSSFSAALYNRDLFSLSGDLPSSYTRLSLLLPSTGLDSTIGGSSTESVDHDGFSRYSSQVSSSSTETYPSHEGPTTPNQPTFLNCSDDTRRVAQSDTETAETPSTSASRTCSLNMRPISQSFFGLFTDPKNGFETSDRELNLGPVLPTDYSTPTSGVPTSLQQPGRIDKPNHRYKDSEYNLLNFQEFANDKINLLDPDITYTECPEVWYIEDNDNGEEFMYTNFPKSGDHMSLSGILERYMSCDKPVSPGVFENALYGKTKYNWRRLQSAVSPLPSISEGSGSEEQVAECSDDLDGSDSEDSQVEYYQRPPAGSSGHSSSDSTVSRKSGKEGNTKSENSSVASIGSPSDSTRGCSSGGALRDPPGYPSEYVSGSFSSNILSSACMDEYSTQSFDLNDIFDDNSNQSQYESQEGSLFHATGKLSSSGKSYQKKSCMLMSKDGYDYDESPESAESFYREFCFTLGRNSILKKPLSAEIFESSEKDETHKCIAVLDRSRLDENETNNSMQTPQPLTNITVSSKNLRIFENYSINSKCTRRSAFQRSENKNESKPSKIALTRTSNRGIPCGLWSGSYMSDDGSPPLPDDINHESNNTIEGSTNRKGVLRPTEQECKTFSSFKEVLQACEDKGDQASSAWQTVGCLLEQIETETAVSQQLSISKNESLTVSLEYKVRHFRVLSAGQFIHDTLGLYQNETYQVNDIVNKSECDQKLSENFSNEGITFADSPVLMIDYMGASETFVMALKRLPRVCPPLKYSFMMPYTEKVKDFLKELLEIRKHVTELISLGSFLLKRFSKLERDIQRIIEESSGQSFKYQISCETGCKNCYSTCCEIVCMNSSQNMIKKRLKKGIKDRCKIDCKISKSQTKECKNKVDSLERGICKAKEKTHLVKKGVFQSLKDISENIADIRTQRDEALKKYLDISTLEPLLQTSSQKDAETHVCINNSENLFMWIHGIDIHELKTLLRESIESLIMSLKLVEELSPIARDTFARLQEMNRRITSNLNSAGDYSSLNALETPPPNNLDDNVLDPSPHFSSISGDLIDGKYITIDEGVDENQSIIVEDINQNTDEDFKQDVDEYVEQNTDENIERNANEDMEQMIDVANDYSIGDEKIVVVVDDDELGYDDNTEDGGTQLILIQDEDSDENGDNSTNYENMIVKLENEAVEFDIGRERSSTFLPIEEKRMSCNFPDISTRNGIYMARVRAVNDENASKAGTQAMAQITQTFPDIGSKPSASQCELFAQITQIMREKSRHMKNPRARQTYR